jgi:hypothetical protein
MEGAAAEQRIVGTHFNNNKYDYALHTESHEFQCNAYKKFSVHMATNLQSTGTAKNAITLLLKEV